jgi:hypothetical protein
MTALAGLVGHVDIVVAQEQVIRIAARRVVAAMQYELLRRQGHAMYSSVHCSVNVPPSTAIGRITIAFLVAEPLPFPAACFSHHASLHGLIDPLAIVVGAKYPTMMLARDSGLFGGLFAHLITL